MVKRVKRVKRVKELGVKRARGHLTSLLQLVWNKGLGRGSDVRYVFFFGRIKDEQFSDPLNQFLWNFLQYKVP